MTTYRTTHTAPRTRLRIHWREVGATAAVCAAIAAFGITAWNLTAPAPQPAPVAPVVQTAPQDDACYLAATAYAEVISAAREVSATGMPAASQDIIAEVIVPIMAADTDLRFNGGELAACLDN